MSDRSFLTRSSQLVLAGAGAVIALVLPSIVPSQMSLLVMVGVFYLVTIGMTPLVGQSGQVSLGQTLFMALGGYGSGLLSARWHWPTLLSAIVMAVVCCGIALLVGSAFLRLRGYYFALATLGLAVGTYAVSSAWASLTGGPSGLVGVPSLSLFGFQVFSDRANFYMLVIVGAVAAWIANNLRNSQKGRALAAVGNDSVAAGMLGIQASRYKTAAFAFAAITASLAGSLYAFYLRFFSPDIVSVTVAFSIIVIVAIGGSRSVLGPLIGALVIQGLPQAGQTFATWEPLVAGMVLILVMIYFPDGLWGAVVDGARRLTPGARSAVALEGETK